VSKSFQGVRAVDDLTIRFGGEGVEGVIGPNGAGKTTLFRLLSGFTRADRGSVVLDGRSLDRMSAHGRAHAGLARTFQEQEVFPNLTVGEVVTTAAMMRQPLRDARRIALRITTEMDLPWSATADELTPAQVRRMELARVEAAEPKVALFDEVMAGLTPTEASFMVERIGAMADRGVTVVVVEHVMSVVTRLCQRVHVLVSGRLLMTGSPTQVTSDPRVVQAYLGRRTGGDHDG
jgi:ABC-type branched-subunit amino acid transport system ATPase component